MNNYILKIYNENFKNNKISVIGDFMIDKYRIYKFRGIAQECVCKIYINDGVYPHLYKYDSPGGAGYVSQLVNEFQNIVTNFGHIGLDKNSYKMRVFFENKNTPNIFNNYFEENLSYRIPVKKRYIQRNEYNNYDYIMRFDEETTPAAITSENHKNLISYINSNLHNQDAVIISDYNKGVVTKQLLKNVLEYKDKHNFILTIDPHPMNLSVYENNDLSKVDLIKCNLKEAHELVNKKYEYPICIINSIDDPSTVGKNILEDIGKEFYKKFNINNFIFTLDEMGLVLYDKGNLIKHFPTKVVKNPHVVGLGDIIISLITIGLSAGLDLESSIKISILGTQIAITKPTTYFQISKELDILMYKEYNNVKEK